MKAANGYYVSRCWSDLNNCFDRYYRYFWWAWLCAFLDYGTYYAITSLNVMVKAVTWPTPHGAHDEKSHNPHPDLVLWSHRRVRLLPHVQFNRE